MKYRIAGHPIVFSVRRGTLFTDLARLFNKSGWHKQPSWSLWQTWAAELGLHATDLAAGQEWVRILKETLAELLATHEGHKAATAVFPFVRGDSDGGRTIKKAVWSKYYL